MGSGCEMPEHDSAPSVPGGALEHALTSGNPVDTFLDALMR